jgi:hypothetical protein
MVPLHPILRSVLKHPPAITAMPIQADFDKNSRLSRRSLLIWIILSVTPYTAHKEKLKFTADYTTIYGGRVKVETVKLRLRISGKGEKCINKLTLLPR